MMRHQHLPAGAVSVPFVTSQSVGLVYNKKVLQAGELQDHMTFADYWTIGGLKYIDFIYVLYSKYIQ